MIHAPVCTTSRSVGCHGWSVWMWSRTLSTGGRLIDARWVSSAAPNRSLTSWASGSHSARLSVTSGGNDRPGVDSNTRTSRLPFISVGSASAGDSAGGPGSCRKSPGALYVERSGCSPSPLSSAVDGTFLGKRRSVRRHRPRRASRGPTHVAAERPAQPRDVLARQRLHAKIVSDRIGHAHGGITVQICGHRSTGSRPGSGRVGRRPRLHLLGPRPARPGRRVAPGHRSGQHISETALRMISRGPSRLVAGVGFEPTTSGS